MILAQLNMKWILCKRFVSPDTYESLIPSLSITELQLCGHISLDQDHILYHIFGSSSQPVTR